MKEIPLTQNKVALVDDEDYDELSKHRWYAYRGRKTFYAERTKSVFGRGKITILMHREILGARRPLEVDHIDGNGLNNQKTNLRLCSAAENRHNSPRNYNNSSGYKGVSFAAKRGKYVSQICVRGKQINLGRYSTAVEAARVRDIYAKKQYGEFAWLNFPEAPQCCRS
jgi:hypothetical protein